MLGIACFFVFCLIRVNEKYTRNFMVNRDILLVIF